MREREGEIRVDFLSFPLCSKDSYLCLISLKLENLLFHLVNEFFFNAVTQGFNGSIVAGCK